MTVLATGDLELGEVLAMLVVLIILVMPIAIVVYGVIDLRRQLRATALGEIHCQHCGYDLRAACHQCCPECGHAISSEEHVKPKLGD